LPDSPSVRKYISESFKKYPELPKYLSVNIERPDEFASRIIDRLLYPIKHKKVNIYNMV
jgi:hypothetical protein